MNILLLIPSVLKTGVDDQIRDGRHPRMDYCALAAALSASNGNRVTLTGYAEADRDGRLLVRLAHRLAGRDGALAAIGFLDRARYDSVFTNGENVSIPLALLFGLSQKRPRHVTIGHRLSTGKKRLFFKLAGVHKHIDAIFVYASTQRRYAEEELGIEPERLRLIAFHADERFFSPDASGTHPNSEHRQICSAGLEWRDYPTLIDAIAPVPNLRVRLAAASPWSKHVNETEKRELPSHVDARRYDYGELRTLYAESDLVVVPLYQNDFQAGVTTLLEAMAMGKAVIVTKTIGQTDVVVDGENGVTVPPGDAAALRSAIERLLADDGLRERLGVAARRWVEENASLDRWTQSLAQTICSSFKEPVQGLAVAKAGRDI